MQTSIDVGGDRDRVSVRPVGRCRLCVRCYGRQLIIRRRPKNAIDGSGDLSLSHAPVQQQKGSLDLSEQEAPTHLLVICEPGRIGPAPLALFVSGNVALVVSWYQPSASPLCRGPLQQQQENKENTTPFLHWQKKEIRASSSTITPGRLPIEH